ncbi:MAG: A/G-specific adenine glycosylase [Chthoniobacterales bacterium]|nr:A/G-specific adenine glycosylase [Chthoniobacterales bacterium]
MQQKLLTWFCQHGRHDLPWRQSPTPYDVLVSEFMLQQTTVATIVPRFQDWMNRFPTLEILATASEDEVLSAWQGLGYYARARRLHQVAQAIVTFHQGKIPQDLSTLLKLPGVGPYTASALRAFAFNQPTAVLDTNIVRVIARLHNITEPTDSKKGKEQIALAAQEMLPKKEGYAFASALMDLGAMICTAANPQCKICPLSSNCLAEHPTTLPRKKPKPSITRKKEARLFYQHDDRIYLEQSSGPHWKGLWILPLAVSIHLHKNYLTSITYPITRYRITMKLYRETGTPPKNLHPFSKKELQTLAIPSPHRRAIEKLILLS